MGSRFGDWFNEVALAQVTLTLTHSPVAMGFVLLCRALPGVLLGPFAGPLVDRLAKRPLLYRTDWARALLALALSLAVILQANWVLYVGAALLGASGAPFGPARKAAVPRIVAPGDLTVANGLDTQAAGVVQILGAAGGGLVASALGPIACFAVNAASYLWSAWHIRQCRWEEPPAAGEGHGAYFASLRAGLREAVRNRVVRAVILIGVSWGLAGGGYYILVPVLGQRVFHMGGLGIGLLYAIDGIGVLAGAYGVNRLVAGRHRRAALWYGVAYLTQAIFFSAMTQFSVFAWGALMLLLMRISSGVIIPLDTYIVQASTEPAVQGRVFALHGSTYGGVMQISFAATGIAIARFGVPAAGLVIGAVSLLCGVSWLLQFGGAAA